MRKFKIEMTVETDDILEEYSADDHAYELRELIDRETYGQLSIKSLQVKEVSWNESLHWRNTQ